jgi:hypothetical protein
VFGYCCGGTLALRAAASSLAISKLAISKLALYEPPFPVDGSRPPLPAELPERLAQLVATGRRGEAVERYQTEVIGIPQEVVAGMRQAPFRPAPCWPSSCRRRSGRSPDQLAARRARVAASRSSRNRLRSSPPP